MFLGTFEDWFYKFVLGIQSTSTAFRTVQIAPAFTGVLVSASGWTLTPFGNLSVAYSSGGGALALRVGVPVGVTATVSFVAGATVREGGKPLGRREGFEVLASLKGAPVQVAVGSGVYSFVAE